MVQSSTGHWRMPASGWMKPGSEGADARLPPPLRWLEGASVESRLFPRRTRASMSPSVALLAACPLLGAGLGASCSKSSVVCNGGLRARLLASRCLPPPAAAAGSDAAPPTASKFAPESVTILPLLTTSRAFGS